MFFLVLYMQQTINSYNLYKVPSTNLNIGPSQTANFVIGSGVYEIDGSSVQIRFNDVQTGANDKARIYCRSDCTPMFQAPCVVTMDGIQKAQYLQLTIQQLAYAQDEMTFTGDRLDQSLSNNTTTCQTKKLFEEIGVQNTGNVAQTYYKSFQLKHFLPNIWNKGDKYFEVKSNCTITCNLGSMLLTQCLAMQLQNLASVNSQLQQVSACGSIDITFFLKRITNQVEQAAMQIQPLITCFLQQSQSLTQGSGTFNQSFGANQISTKQYMCLATVQGTRTQFDIEEFDSVTAGTYNIQRCGVNIVSAEQSGECKAQLALLKSVHKKNYNNLIVAFDTVFSNCNIQTQFTVPAALLLFGYLGYEYVMQVM